MGIVIRDGHGAVEGEGGSVAVDLISCQHGALVETSPGAEAGDDESFRSDGRDGDAVLGEVG